MRIINTSGNTDQSAEMDERKRFVATVRAAESVTEKSIRVLKDDVRNKANELLEAGGYQLGMKSARVLTVMKAIDIFKGHGESN